MDNPIKTFIVNTVAQAFGWDRDPYEMAYEARKNILSGLIDYYNGNQRKPLKRSGLGKDYNVITNHTKTIVDRSVSTLVGSGVEFDLPSEGESKQDEIVSAVWKANKKDILLHDLVQFGSIYGTAAIKIVPQGITSLDGITTYRLVTLNPYNLTIITEPDDIANIRAYIIRWNDGETAWREITKNGISKTNEDQSVEVVTGWTIETQKLDKSTGNKWFTTNTVLWDYPFPPIAHGKNLPRAGSVYGCSDIEDIIELQDRYNETQSNVNKILSLQAWAQKWVTGGSWPVTTDDKGHKYLDMAPDKALEFKDAGTKVGILQPSGDLDSSNQFSDKIRRDMFEIAATVDADTVADKIGGGLTNFGLKVLFKNELAKNATKQLLYGDLLLAVNNRILQLEGFMGAESDPGTVKFGNPLPVNKVEQIENLTSEHDLGITSIETAAKEIGRDWEVEKERLANEKQDTAGGDLIRTILSGK